MSTTWTQLGPNLAKAVCTTGNESAPTLATDGMPLFSASAVAVVAAADSGQTFTATPGGTLQVYLYDPVVGAWARCPDVGEPAISLASQRYQAFPAFSVLVRRGGRIALVPSGVTLSSGGITIYLSGEPFAR